MNKRIGVLMYQTSVSKGQELVAQRMVADFNALGQKAFLITSVFHDGNEVIQSESLREQKGYVFTDDPELGIPIIRVESHTVKWPRRRIGFTDFVQVLERIVEDFDLNVLITHSTLWNGPEDVAKFVFWRRYMRNLGGYKDPLVFCHMSHFQEPTAKRYSVMERTFRMAWNRISLSQILKTANLILVVTPLEKEAKVKMGAYPKKCLLFPSGVDDELFLRYATADPNQFLKQHKIPDDVKLVSYLGTLEDRKNPLGILEVAKLLHNRHDIHFAIAGRGEPEYAAKVKEEAELLSNVTYLGEVDDKDKILLINSSHVNILLSQLEALGLTQIEFMYQGVPIVTSGVGGQSWLVQNGKQGIHTAGPEDYEGAANAITKLVDDSDLWSQLSEKAKEKGRELTCSRAIRRLDEAIDNELLKENGLLQLPVEIRGTLLEPENVAKAWKRGSWSAVATEERLFVKHGRFSRKVTEMPYRNIQNIEHARRYSLGILAAGFLPALIYLLAPLWQITLSGEFLLAIAGISSLVNLVPLALPAILFAPMLVGLSGFVIQSRTGFNLCGTGTKPVYLPFGFKEVITFVRQIQDQKLRVDSCSKLHFSRVE
jgi:D-inositol-3-phosphate glycosyltransferase